MCEDRAEAQSTMESTFTKHIDTPYRIRKITKYNGQVEYYLDKSWFSSTAGATRWETLGMYETLEDAQKEKQKRQGNETKSIEIIE